MLIFVHAERDSSQLGGLEKSTAKLIGELKAFGFETKEYSSSLSCYGDVSSALMVYLPRLFQGMEREHISSLAMLSKDVPIVLRFPTTMQAVRVSKYDRSGILKDRISLAIAQNADSYKALSRYFGVSKVVHSPNTCTLTPSWGGTWRGHFLFAGRITPSKNLHGLIKAYARYRAIFQGDAIPLEIYGPIYSQKYYKSCQELADGILGITFNEPYVRNGSDIFRKASFIVIPSFREGHSNTMLEAVCAGVPVIASILPGLVSEKNVPWSIGIASPSSTDSVYQVLSKAHSLDREQYDFMCLKARNYAEALPTESQQATAIVDFFRSRLARSNITIFVLKPESLIRKTEFLEALEENGFELVAIERRSDWKNFMDSFYFAMSAAQKDKYSRTAEVMQWGTSYEVILAKHHKANAIELGNQIKGNHDTYQINNEDTLRSRFGLPEHYNVQIEGEPLIFNGVHATRTIDELLRTINYMNWWNNIMA